MRRALVLWLLVSVLLLAQPTPQPKPQQAEAVNPAARYSPTAASGRPVQRETFWGFLLRQFNPQGTDWGTVVEQRRAAYVRHVALNPYFWYSFAATALCLLLTVALAAAVDSRLCFRELAGALLADLANYNEHCRRVAQEAIARHNEHIEVCNRVIESETTGRPVGLGETDGLRRELDRLRGELDAKTADNLRLTAELDGRKAALLELSARVDRLTKNPPKADPNPALVERVNRLEAELAEARQAVRARKGS